MLLTMLASPDSMWGSQGHYRVHLVSNVSFASERRDVSLTGIVSTVRSVVADDLSDSEYTRVRCESWPKVLSNIVCGGNAQSINVVLASEVLHPAVQHIDNEGALRIEIGEKNLSVSNPAVLELPLVCRIVDRTLTVVVCLVHERKEVRYIGGCGVGGHIVHVDVQHEEHLS